MQGLHALREFTEISGRTTAKDGEGWHDGVRREDRIIKDDAVVFEDAAVRDDAVLANNHVVANLKRSNDGSAVNKDVIAYLYHLINKKVN